MINWIKIGKIVSNTISGVSFVVGVFLTLNTPEAWFPLGIGLFLSLIAPHAISDRN